MAKENQELG